MAVMEALYQTNTSVFYDFVGRNLAHFWDQVREDDPKLMTVRDKLTDGWQCRTVPYFLHGDAAVFALTNQSILGINFKPVLGESFGCSILALFAMVKSVCVSHREFSVSTEGVIWRYIVLFLNAGFHGVHAPLDPDNVEWPPGSFEAAWAGRKFCGGMFTLFPWMFPADMEYNSNHLGMSHFNSNDPCSFCPANRWDDSLNNVALAAEWKKHVTPFPDGCKHKPTGHSIMNIIGATRYHLVGDLMHTGLLGTDEYMAGSVLYELIHDGPRKTGSVDQRREFIWNLCLEEYERQQTPNRVANLTMSMVQSKNEYPCLSIKAAEMLGFLPVLLAVCRYVHDGSDRDEHRIRALKYMVSVYAILKRNGMFLSDLDAHEALHCIEMHLVHYNWLAQHSVSRSVRAYILQYKHHNLYHLAEYARFFNPIFCWCFQFEDFMQVLKTSARNCIAGTPMAIVGKKIIQNFVLVLELTLRCNIRSTMVV